ncbi:MAG: ribonuclease H-like domain-containing protein [Saprospiraceae bacterium]|nr:ribonuclease H-like domain-containing protein [Saprospiraceae bacterium]
MIAHLALDQILFIDIETVSEHPDLTMVPEPLQDLWQQKGGRFARYAGQEWTPEVAAETYEQKAAIFAEFGRVVVISAGFLYRSEGGWAMKIKSFARDDERALLHEFAQLLDQHYSDPSQHYLCGHNIREFDIPFLCRRMIIKGLALPDIINVTGKKPWETAHFLDTMTFWKFGDIKHYTSLSLLATILGVPTPKDDIDGSDVGRVYWEENDLARIVQYCEKDVATVAQVLLRLQGMEMIPSQRIASVASQETT